MKRTIIKNSILLLLLLSVTWIVNMRNCWDKVGEGLSNWKINQDCIQVHSTWKAFGKIFLSVKIIVPWNSQTIRTVRCYHILYCTGWSQWITWWKVKGKEMGPLYSSLTFLFFNGLELPNDPLLYLTGEIGALNQSPNPPFYSAARNTRSDYETDSSMFLHLH